VWQSPHEDPIEYLETEIISTPNGLPGPLPIETDGLFEVSRTEMDRLLAGEIGPYQLFTAPNALLRGKPMPPAVADQAADYTVRRNLQPLIDQLPADQVEALALIVQGLLK